MLLSLGMDLTPTEQDADGFRVFTDRLRHVDAAAPDIVIFGGEQDGIVVPGRLEGLVNLSWAAGLVRSAAVVAVLPALHAVPFHVARALSAIDFVSNGRAGWMPACANRTAFDRAYGADYALDDADATAKADDFVRATQALWDSWDQDALIIDKESGDYLDSSKIRRVDYRGPFFQTMGPLNAARPLQGYPLLVRDLDDLSAQSDVPADIVLLSVASAAEARSRIAALRAKAATASAAILLKTGIGLSLEDAAGVETADGVHICGLPGAADIVAARALFPASDRAGDTARARLGMARPANPYIKKALV